MWTLIAIMLGAGLVGGSVNYLQARKSDPEGSSLRLSLTAGVVASFMVPLFLNMLSSNLIDSALTQPSKMLVFVGFCLVAAVSSTAFISSLSDRVLKEAKKATASALEAKGEVQHIQAQVQPIIVKETEPEESPEAERRMVASLNFDGGSAPAHTLDPDFQPVIAALANPKFTLRSRTGIAQEAGLEKDQVSIIMKALVDKGLAGSTTTLDDKTRYFLTEEGRRLANLL